MRSATSLSLLALLCVPTLLHAQQSEVEPNNDMASANMLNLGGTMSGSWCDGEPADLFQVVVPLNGRLDVDLSVTHSSTEVNETVRVWLYDNAGTAVQDFWATSGPNGFPQTNPHQFTCVAAGTYYVGVDDDFNDTCNSYVLSVDLALPTFMQDVEDNDSPAQAIVWAENSWTSGTVNYSYHDDDADWYRIDLPQDGYLTVEIEGANQVMGTYAGEVALMDAGQDTLSDIAFNIGQVFVSGDTGFTTLTHPCLGADTYYMRMKSASCGTSYRIRWDVIPAPGANDAENNDELAEALTLLPGVLAEGHLDFGTADDNSDWYRFHVYGTADAAVTVTASHQDGAGSYYLPIDLVDQGGTLINTQNYTFFGNWVPVPQTISWGTLTDGDYYIHLVSPACGTSYGLTMSGIGNLGVAEPAPGSAVLYADAQRPGLFRLVSLKGTVAALHVFDHLGRVVRNGRIPTSTEAIAVDLTDQASGLYTVHVAYADGTRWSTKVMVAH
jgi:hypothetical protein